jgi:uncharacterized protein Yka (UPF0111/DUF47 family)
MKKKIYVIAFLLLASTFTFIKYKQYKKKEKLIIEIKELTDRADRITRELDEQMKDYLE